MMSRLPRWRRAKAFHPPAARSTRALGQVSEEEYRQGVGTLAATAGPRSRSCSLQSVAAFGRGKAWCVAKEV